MSTREAVLAQLAEVRLGKKNIMNAREAVLEQLAEVRLGLLPFVCTRLGRGWP